MLLGAHESVAGGIHLAFDRGLEHGAEAIQIFIRSSRQWAAKPIEAAERDAFRARLAETGLATMAHGSYLLNLATEDEALRERSVARLADELAACDLLGVRHLVFHPGSHPDTDRGLTRVAEALDEIHRRVPEGSARICIENTAGQGNCLGHTADHLAAILGRARTGARLELCLDTCHLLAAGYDIGHRAGYDATLAELDAAFGLERVSCFHLNDSKKPVGCRVDRHEEIGKGVLGLEAFEPWIRDERFARLPAVLETPNPDAYGESLRRLRALASKGSHAPSVEGQAPERGTRTETGGARGGGPRPLQTPRSAKAGRKRADKATVEGTGRVS